MTFKKFFKLYLENVEDDIEYQKGKHHTSKGNDSRFWGNRGAGVLIYCEKTKRFLLGLRSEWVNEPHTWGTFGGSVDGDTDPKMAALRELAEETKYNGSINIKPIDVFESGNFKFYNFLGIVSDEFTPTLDWENEDAQWFSLNKFPQNLHFGLKRLIPKLTDHLLNISIVEQYELLQESHRIYYHYTNALPEILSTNVFELGNALLASSESGHLPKGVKQPYFMSMSRNPSGSYKSDTLLVLDGDKLSQKYKIIPTNYWGRRVGIGGGSEMEDRLWSSSPIIKNAKSYIKEIHMFVSKERLKDEEHPLVPSNLEYLDIPFYIYTDDRKDLYLMNTSKAISREEYDQSEKKFTMYNREDQDLQLIEFLETGQAKGNTRFSSYRFYPRDFVDGIRADLHNMRSKKGVLYRELHKRLVNLFKKYNSTDVYDFLKKRYNDLVGRQYFDV